MPLDVRLFPALEDNYGFLARDEATGQVAAIDTPDAAAVLKAAEEAGWTITMILNTHWHPDHTQGNEAVKAATGLRDHRPGGGEARRPHRPGGQARRPREAGRDRL